MIKRIYDYFDNMNFYKFLFFVQTIALILMFAFCSPLAVKAASDQTYYPMQQNENNTIPDAVVNYFKNRYSINEDNTYWFCFGPHSNGSGTNKMYYFLYWDKSSTGTITAYANSSNSAYQFKLYKNGSFTNFGNALGMFTINGDFVNSNYSSSTSGFLQSGYVYTSSVYNHSISYRSNFDLVDRYDSSKVYLLFFVPIEIPEGVDPSSPNMSSLDLDSSLNTTTIPTTPTYSNSFNDPLPTYDPTAPVQSLVDVVIWGFNRVHSFFQSFVEYFLSWLGYFINILTYLIQKIIDGIKFIVTWLYNQFLNWLTPYLKILNLIASFLFNTDEQKSVLDLLGDIKTAVLSYVNTYFPPDYSPITTKIEDFMTAFNSLKNFFTADPNYAFIYNTFIGTYFGQIFTSGNALLTAIVNAFREIQTPQTLVFTVNFTTAPSPFNEVGLLSFDFGWYASIRSVIEPIVVCCLYIGCGLHILSSIRSLFGDTASLVPDTKVDSINTPAMNRARAESRARANAVRARHRK